MSRGRLILALVLLVPAPTIGTLAALELFPGSPLGNAIFTISKLWFFAFPVVWLKLVDRGHLGISPVRKGGLLAGVVSGTVIGLLILAGYLVFGHRLVDNPVLIGKVREIGLETWPAFLGGAAYWVLVNSVLEEYAWRWFVYSKCEALVRPSAAVVLTAIFFTLHHFIVLQFYCGIPIAVAVVLGVFLAGVLWSLMYMRYQSIWPGYLSHAIIDLFIFGIGAAILFGNH